MKNWKKNMIAAAVLVVVCAGIYLNWNYSQAQETADLMSTLDAEKVMSDDTLVLNDALSAAAGEDLDTDTMTDYFAAVRLSRQEARDSAVGLLQEAMAYEDSATGSASSAQLEEIVQTALTEAQIESLIIAKGYADCVAYMSDGGISVAVAVPEGGLQAQDVAIIADIVMTQSGCSFEDIHVVEVY